MKENQINKGRNVQVLVFLWNCMYGVQANENKTMLVENERTTFENRKNGFFLKDYSLKHRQCFHCGVFVRIEILYAPRRASDTGRHRTIRTHYIDFYMCRRNSYIYINYM